MTTGHYSSRAIILLYTGCHNWLLMLLINCNIIYALFNASEDVAMQWTSRQTVHETVTQELQRNVNTRKIDFRHWKHQQWRNIIFSNENRKCIYQSLVEEKESDADMENDFQKSHALTSFEPSLKLTIMRSLLYKSLQVWRFPLFLASLHACIKARDKEVFCT